MMKSLRNKIIVYDGNCYLCSKGAELTPEFSRIPEEKLIAYDNLSPHQRSRVQFEKFRNEMALIDEGNDRTLYGLEGILYIIGCRFPFAGRIKTGSIGYSIINHFYRMVAFNRYIIFPPPSRIKCDCQPPMNKKYRLILFSWCALISVIITSLLGLTISKQFGSPAFETVLMTLISIASGWMVQLSAALIFLRGEQRFDYITTLGVIMLTGVIILIPGLFTVFLEKIIYIIVMGVFVIASFVTMMRMHHKRARMLNLNSSWIYSLVILLQLAVILTIYILI